MPSMICRWTPSSNCSPDRLLAPRRPPACPSLRSDDLAGIPPDQHGELVDPPLALSGGGAPTKKPLLAVLEGASDE